MGRHHAALPFHVAGTERLGHRVMFEQDSQLREFAQILDRDRRDLEAALAFGDHKTLRGQAVEDLAQRADADAVILLHRVELEASRRRQHAENDVGANAVIAAVAGRHGWLGCSRIVNVSVPLSVRDGLGNSPAAITANVGLQQATGRHDEYRIIIYFEIISFDNGFRCMVCSEKTVLAQKIAATSRRVGARSYQGGIDEAVCSSVRGCVRRVAFGRRRIRARGPGADDPVGAPQQHRPSRQLRRAEIRGNPAGQERRQAEGSRVRLVPARQRVAAAVGAARRHAGDAVGFHHVARNRRSGIRPARFPVHRQHHRSGRCAGRRAHSARR